EKQGQRAAGGEGGAMYNKGSKPALINCTLAQNRAHLTGNALACYAIIPRATHRGDVQESTKCIVELCNCILWGSSREIWKDTISAVTATYSNIQGGWPGEGNINADPCFVSPGYWGTDGATGHSADIWVDGDYHLRSQAGRWDPSSKTWLRDDATSPCIDAGSVSSPIGHEPVPNGGVVNMGAYGGTAEASKSYFDGPPCETIMAGDINGDCKVDWADLALVTSHWLWHDPAVHKVPPRVPPNKRPTVTITEPEDGAIIHISEAGTHILIRAVAYDSDGRVASVRFTIERSDAHTSYSLSHSGKYVEAFWQFAWIWWDGSGQCPTDGAYTITATALDDDGAKKESQIVIHVDGPK
ncbi:MAG: Ig-like domain-containing protein, partial [Phycisphaerales bacterium]